MQQESHCENLTAFVRGSDAIESGGVERSERGRTSRLYLHRVDKNPWIDCGVTLMENSLFEHNMPNLLIYV